MSNANKFIFKLPCKHQNNTVRYKILEEENFGKFGELQENCQNFLLQFVIRKYACKHVNDVVKVFKLKPTSKQLLADPDGELRLKIPSSGISLANACKSKLLDGAGWAA